MHRFDISVPHRSIISFKQKDFAEETKLVLDKVEPDAKFWINVCKKFLKSN